MASLSHGIYVAHYLFYDMKISFGQDVLEARVFAILFA